MSDARPPGRPWTLAPWECGDGTSTREAVCPCCGEWEPSFAEFVRTTTAELSAALQRPRTAPTASSYAAAVNAPLPAETIKALAAKLKTGEARRRKVRRRPVEAVDATRDNEPAIEEDP